MASGVYETSRLLWYLLSHYIQDLQIQYSFVASNESCPHNIWRYQSTLLLSVLAVPKLHGQPAELKPRGGSQAYRAILLEGTTMV